MADKRNEDVQSRRDFLKLMGKTAIGLTAANFFTTGLVRLIESLNHEEDSPTKHLLDTMNRLRQGKISQKDFRAEVQDMLGNIANTETPKSMGPFSITTGPFKDDDGNPTLTINYNSTKPKNERLFLSSSGISVDLKNPLNFLKENRLEDENFYFWLTLNLNPIYGKPRATDSIQVLNTFLVSSNDMKIINDISWYVGKPTLLNDNLIMSISKREDYDGDPPSFSKTVFEQHGYQLASDQYSGNRTLTLDSKGNVIDSFTDNDNMDPKDLVREYDKWISILVDAKVVQT